MIRLLIFFLIIAGLAYGFSWISDNPGTVAMTVAGNQYEVSLAIAAVALVMAVVVLMVVWALIRMIWKSPKLFSGYFRARRRDRGYEALSSGLIAASAGNSAEARRQAKQSGKLLGNNAPLVKLLNVQTAMLEGNTRSARENFTEMLGNDATRLIALRGLYLEAEKEGNSTLALQYAEEAARSDGSLPWAGNAKLRHQGEKGDFEAALRTLEANLSAGLVTKEEAARKRAVLLTALAYQEEQANPQRSAKLAQQAAKLAPDLVPAAVIGARALIRQNKTGNAAKMIENAWKRNPHPELAETYVHARAGDSVRDRLERARRLASFKTNHPEGNIAIAEAAIDAKEWQEARKAMEPVLRSNLTERACLIMADIEEGEHGNRGRMREWLSRAVRAPRDAAWTADGHISEKWLPVSPVTGEIDAFEWKVPVAQLSAPDSESQVIDIEELVKPLPAIAAGVASEKEAAAPAKQDNATEAKEVKVDSEVSADVTASPVTPVETEKTAEKNPAESEEQAVPATAKPTGKTENSKPEKPETAPAPTDKIKSLKEREMEYIRNESVENKDTSKEDTSKADTSQSENAPTSTADVEPAKQDETIKDTAETSGNTNNAPKMDGAESETQKADVDEKSETGETETTKAEAASIEKVSETVSKDTEEISSKPSEAKDGAKDEEAEDSSRSDKDGEAKAKDSKAGDEKDDPDFHLTHRPDDPGVDPEKAEPEDKKWYKLF